MGVNKASNRAELRHALSDAARYDAKLLVERGVDARELECGVLGNDDPMASVVGEIVPGGEFYDYRAKYLDTVRAPLIPADIPPAIAEEVRRLAVLAFKAIDAAGLARVDFFLERGTDRLLLNEINTLPASRRSACTPSCGKPAASASCNWSIDSSSSASNGTRTGANETSYARRPVTLRVLLRRRLGRLGHPRPRRRPGASSAQPNVSFLYVGTRDGPEAALAAPTTSRSWPSIGKTPPLLGRAQSHRSVQGRARHRQAYQTDTRVPSAGRLRRWWLRRRAADARRPPGRRPHAHPPAGRRTGLGEPRCSCPSRRAITVSLPSSVAHFPRSENDRDRQPGAAGDPNADPDGAIERLGLEPDVPCGRYWRRHRRPGPESTRRRRGAAAGRLAAGGAPDGPRPRRPRGDDLAALPRSRVPGRRDAARPGGAAVLVTRAGMGTLTELAALEKPALVVPLPDSHQWANAMPSPAWEPSKSPTRPP